MALGDVNLRDLIAAEAAAQGVPPEIALGVAQTESGISQWLPNGNVVTSPKGALGVFQLMPATAAGLGVDPTDLSGNIKGGITFLKDLYDKFGNWSDALAAYNWGPGNVSSGASIPTSVMGYVSKVLGLAGGYSAPSPPPPPSTAPALAPGVDTSSWFPDLSAAGLEANVTPLSAGVVAVGVIAGVAAIAWLMNR
jgi:soluble lytic murein transglycosylase-like protein